MRVLILLCAVAVFPALAQVPTGPATGSTLSWIWHQGTANADKGNAVAATAEGVYSTGESLGSFDSQVPVGASDVVVTKHLPNGARVWSKMHGTSVADVGTGIATYTVPATPQVYVTGYTAGSWGAANQGGNDAFLVRLNPATGERLWTRQFGTTARDEATSVATDPSGGIYVAGFTMGSLGAPNAGLSDGFLAKYDSAGNPLWTQQFGTSAVDSVRGVAADANNDVYVVGSTGGSLGGPTAGGVDLFIVKYTGSTGSPQWRRQLGTDGSEDIYGVATSRQGNGTIDVYVVGYTDKGFDGHTSQGGRDAIIVKFDGLGNKLWSRQFGTAGSEMARGIASDGGANVYITGYSNYDIVAGTPDSSYNFFMVKYDAAGNEVVRRQLGSVNVFDPAEQEDAAHGVAADINDSVYVTGFTEGGFTNPSTMNQGAEDYVLFRYADGCQINTPGLCGIGYGWGDPHLVTFDNRSYDFQGAGEFIFVESRVVAAPFTVQARMQPWVNNNQVTVMTAVATRLGTGRAGIYLTAGGGHELRVNGAVVTLAVGGTLPVAGGGRILRRDATSYLLSYPGGDKMLVAVNGTYLDVHFALPPARRGAIHGLLGNFDGNEVNEYSLRNGTQLAPTLSFTELHVGPTSFAASWRISQAESLFDYAQGQSTATFTLPNFPASPATVADLPAAARDAARTRCVAGGVQAGVFLDSCTVDVAVTQDASFIASTARVQAQVQAQRGPQAPVPVPAGNRLYFSNFGAAVGAEWNSNLISRTPNGVQSFLGPFTSQVLRLTLPATGKPGIISLNFDLYILDGWDGDANPSANSWYVQIMSSSWGGTFSNTSSTQSYPRPGSAARTSSIANNTLGYEAGDSIYRLKWRFDTNGTSPIVVTFYRPTNSVSNPLVAAPTWGLDNVEVTQE